MSVPISPSQSAARAIDEIARRIFLLLALEGVLQVTTLLLLLQNFLALTLVGLILAVAVRHANREI